MIENKPKMTTDELISHMKSKGITFENIDEKEAKNILNHKNYYFKLTSYRKNFSKIDNEYQNLDFSYLVDIASIDMQLREYLLSLSLDIEHGVKVKILALITSDPKEDGYEIVRDFKEAYCSVYEQTVRYLEHNKYMNDFYNKHHENISVWALLEVMTFGSLSIFIDFYYKRKHYRAVKTIKNYFKYTKNIRNACAHSNPILVNLFSEQERINHPSAPVTLAAKKMGIEREYIKDLKINDLVSLFYLHKVIQSDKLGEHRYKKGNELIKRLNRNSSWYSEVRTINIFKNILNKLVDYLN